MTHASCDCVECRIRAACGFDVDAPVEIRPIVVALGNVMSEMLAHVPAREAKAYAAEVLVARRKWLKVPFVAAQQPPAGSA